MKKLLSILIIALIIFSTLSFSFTVSAAVYTGSCGSGLSWVFDTGTGVMSISGSGTMNNYYYSTVPWASYRKGINTLLLSDGLNNIGDCAFYDCSSLKKVTIPDNVKTIGVYAFSDCEKLETVSIPLSVRTISEKAFNKCTTLKDVYYGGTKSEWSKISVASGNECLLNANIHFKDSPQQTGSGDVNGDTAVDFKDVLLLRRAVAGIVTLTESQRKKADVNGDGDVDLKDVLKLRRIVAGVE